MPSVAAKDYRCSWEIPYDFHPRIHAYPGVTSVVRAYMNGDSTHSQEPTHPSQKPEAGRSASRRAAARHYRRRPAPGVQPSTVPDSEEEQRTAGQQGDATHEESKARAPAPPASTAPPVRRRLPLQQQQQRSTQRRVAASLHSDNVKGNGTLPTTSEGEAAQATDTVSPPAATPDTRRPATVTRRNRVPSRFIPPPLVRSSDSDDSASINDAHPSHHRAGGGRRHSHDVVSVAGVRATKNRSPSAALAAAAAPHPPPMPRHTVYGSRTKLSFSLPPSYGRTVHHFARQPVPTITTHGLRGQPPGLREYGLDPLQAQHATRQDFVQALSNALSGQQQQQPHSGQASATSPEDYVPVRVLQAYTDTASPATFRPEHHNFNAVVTDAFESSVAERAARLQARERRMWSRLIEHVGPLAEVHARVVAAGGVSVLDSGHVSEPIILSTTVDSMTYWDNGDAAGDVAGGVVMEPYGDGPPHNPGDDRDGGGDTVWANTEEEPLAVVVRPFMEETLSTDAAMREAEAGRRLPKGREWDRQAAIRAAVGATVQEAIVDLGIDPRYRRPGELLLHRNRC